jgi:hypothetical protein
MSIQVRERPARGLRVISYPTRLAIDRTKFLAFTGIPYHYLAIKPTAVMFWRGDIEVGTHVSVRMQCGHQ